MQGSLPPAATSAFRKLLLIGLGVAALLAIGFFSLRKSNERVAQMTVAVSTPAAHSTPRPTAPLQRADRPAALPHGYVDAAGQSITSVPNKPGERPKSGGLQLTRKGADGKARSETVDYYGDGAPGFIPSQMNESMHVQFQWPYATRNVSVTRMDGGSFPGSAKTVMKVPPSDQGAIDFDFVTGAEPGRYQLELLDDRGNSEAIAFWAGPVPDFQPQPTGTEFVDPPLRKSAAAPALNNPQ